MKIMKNIIIYAFEGTGAYQTFYENSPLTGDAGTTAALIAAISAAFIAIAALKTKKK